MRDLTNLTDSEITTSFQGVTSNGNGGNITIASGLAIVDLSNIIAQAQAGNGGNITIDAEADVASTDSTASASSQKGISRVISIAGSTPLNGALVVLSSELRRAVALTANSCAAGGARPQSSLVKVGRGGLPQDPDANLSALYIAGRDILLDPRRGTHRGRVLRRSPFASSGDALRSADAWRLGSQPVGPVVKHRSFPTE